MRSVKFIVWSVLCGVALIAVLAIVLIKQPEAIKGTHSYNIVNRWEMPLVLREISGISWLGNDQLACIEDEDGIIFIYDLKTSKVVETIPFAGSGDFEAIAVNDQDAYVMRSDGIIYKVARFRESELLTISSFQTNFKGGDNMETLCLNADANGLITVPKQRNKQEDFSRLYEIELVDKSMNVIDFPNIKSDDPDIDELWKNEVAERLRPSDIAIHPKTGDYYIIEGRNPKLIILQPDGIVQKIVKLSRKNFNQPEGITFSPDGKLFISNESGESRANIVEVEILAD